MDDYFVCITAGQAVVALGLSTKSWPIMLVGRFIFGLGGENLGVANSAILSIWFEGKELAFAFGLNLSVARLGSVINNLVSPALANSAGIQFALWFGVILCGSSIAAVTLISFVDQRVEYIIDGGLGQHALLPQEDEDGEDGIIEKQRSSSRQSSGSGTNLNASSRDPSLAKKEEKITMKDLWSFRHVFWVLSLICVIVYGCVLPFNNIASALLLERDYFMEPPSDCQLTNIYQCQSSSNPPLNTCPSSKWYQPPLPTNVTSDDVDCTDDYWKDDCTKDYCDRLSDAQLQAGTIMSIPYIISACLSPVLGGVVDRFGFRAVVATIAPAVLVLVHSLMGFTDVDPVGPLVGQGLAYSGFAAVVWPSVALVVEQRLVGLAYGIVVSIQNFGLAVFPLIIASIYSNHGDQYIPSVEVFFVILAVLGVVIGFYLNYVDYFFLDNTLNHPGKRLGARGASFAGNNPQDQGPVINKIFDSDQEVKNFLASGISNGDGESSGRKHSAEVFPASVMN
eukprot:scaffold6806_cov177-Ochromonas_danica.AAC.3